VDNKNPREIHCVELQSWMLTLNPLTRRIWWSPNNANRRQMGFNSAFKGLKPQVNIESLHFKSLFLNRGSMDLCGSTSYALLSKSLIDFKAWASSPQPAGLVRAMDIFANCLHTKKFHNKLRCLVYHLTVISLRPSREPFHSNECDPLQCKNTKSCVISS